ncbi:hypothetical protein GCM10022631_11410 [Deinococcus rubellus]|uniref:type II toxin-antitoxin system HicA family toxin n=1 Tax=Deinococcus rubellus TaxID=1889240 RepID=UPI0031E70EF0
MNRKAKLIAELLAFPTSMDFSDVQRVLEQHGFELRKVSGSHAIFTDGHLTLSIPTISGRVVKRTYLIQIAQALGLGGENE